MSKISEYYSEYLSSVANFEKFHNEVINMPRDKFSDAGYEKIRSLANYFLTTKPYYNFEEGLTYKDILGILIENKIKGLLDKINYRNHEFEDEYLRTDITLDELYDDKDKGGLGFGRLFRHKTEIMAFFGIIKPLSFQKRIIDFDSCQEIAYSNDKLLVSILRNNWLSDNINTNGYVPYLRGINISSDADYRPTYSILKYIKTINRPATLFEISVLFGRIDKVQKEKDIFKRAIEISEELPLNQDEQIQYFFNKMGWRGYSYNRSQEPYFKFRSFIEYMENLELILINNDSSTITLSEYSENLLKDEIPIELLDLESLLYKIDDDKEKESELMNIIINKRTPQISTAIQNDSVLVEKINKRAIRNTEYDEKGKRIRNKFIIELAKVKADYTCEATGRKTFKMPNGQYYVEAHHIIEFSRENGPDITENLIVLGPEKHMLIHHACREEIEDLYRHLLANGIINTDRFRRMHTIYHCLTEEHIQTLLNKKLISSIDKEELLELINS